MSEFALQAEHQKLARLLGCPERTVAALDGLDVNALRGLRAACTSALFDGDRASLQRVAAAARLMPGALNAVIAEKAMGPVLASRVAGLLSPRDAVDIARRVPLAFNVQVTLLLDPRSAAPMLRLMPVDLVVAVTRKVVERREYIAMARFVDALTDEQIRACMAVLDDESMLRIGFFVESMQRLEEVVGLMSDERLQQVTGVAARPALGLDGAMLALLGGVSPDLRLRLLEAALCHPDPRVAANLLASARTHGLESLLSGLRDRLTADSARKLAPLLAS